MVSEQPPTNDRKKGAWLGDPKLKIIVTLGIAIVGFFGIIVPFFFVHPPSAPSASVPIVTVPPTPSSNIYACADVRPATASSGDTVTLDGSCSTTDPNGLIISYSWKQLHGHKVHLYHDTDRISTFTVPQVTHLTTLTFQLTVTDNHLRRDVVIKDIVIN